MTLKPIAVRIPEETEKEIHEIVEHEGVDKATAVRTLLKIGIAEWRKQTALKLLREGKASFAKAAEVAKLSLWEFADLVRQEGITWVNYAPGEIEREAQEALMAESK